MDAGGQNTSVAIVCCRAAGDLVPGQNQFVALKQRQKGTADATGQRAASDLLFKYAWPGTEESRESDRLSCQPQPRRRLE